MFFHLPAFDGTICPIAQREIRLFVPSAVDASASLIPIRNALEAAAWLSWRRWKFYEPNDTTL